jgi:NSS family neurotransmitter:Na+ symporter
MPSSNSPRAERARFATRLGAVFTMIGVAAGLGNIWRFPYMVGEFGGSAFVLLYIAFVFVIGAPALMAEWALGRKTRRGPVGAFARAGLPLGGAVGWFFFFVMTMGAAYYTAVLGWVLFFGLGELARGAGFSSFSTAILPPERGFDARSFVLQAACTGAVILGCVGMIRLGLRAGIERASRLLVPALFVSLCILILRALTLPGAGEGLDWYLLKFEPAAINGRVVVAALGQAIFSLSLGGTFMVIYGSYLPSDVSLPSNARWTAVGDTAVGLLAGLAIFPAVFAFGLEPGSGPGLLFETLPLAFAQMPLGALFGFLFFASLFGVAYLSDVAAFEVLTAGLADGRGIPRERGIWIMAGTVFLCSLPPTLNMAIFVPWDLTFGSGMQTLGVGVAVVTLTWVVSRPAALKELGLTSRVGSRLLFGWLRFAVPGAILLVGLWWLASEVLGLTSGV